MFKRLNRQEVDALNEADRAVYIDAAYLQFPEMPEDMTIPYGTPTAGVAAYEAFKMLGAPFEMYREVLEGEARTGPVPMLRILEEVSEVFMWLREFDGTSYKRDNPRYRVKRGGWSNAASAENGRKAQGGGRPREYGFRPKRGETLLVERQTVFGDPTKTFHPTEAAEVLSVSDTEIELQIGNDIVVIRKPDDNE